MIFQCHIVETRRHKSAVHGAVTMSHTARIVFASALLVFITNSWATETSADCQCRAPDGNMRDLGTVECVNIVGTRKMVRCEMSSNNPYWKDYGEVDGCPDA